MKVNDSNTLPRPQLCQLHKLCSALNQQLISHLVAGKKSILKQPKLVCSSQLVFQIGQAGLLAGFRVSVGQPESQVGGPTTTREFFFLEKQKKVLVIFCNYLLNSFKISIKKNAKIPSYQHNTLAPLEWTIPLVLHMRKQNVYSYSECELISSRPLLINPYLNLQLISIVK